MFSILFGVLQPFGRDAEPHIPTMPHPLTVSILSPDKWGELWHDVPWPTLTHLPGETISLVKWVWYPYHPPVGYKTYWIKAIASGWAQASCDDSCRSFQEPLFNTTKKTAELLITLWINKHFLEDQQQSTIEHHFGHLLLIVWLLLYIVVCLCRTFLHPSVLFPRNQSRIQRNQTNQLYWRGKELGWLTRLVRYDKSIRIKT